MLALNWNREVPQDFSSLGYFSALKVPLNISELRSVCYEALLPARREKFNKLLLWRRDH
jgi:hypothetical protein